VAGDPVAAPPAALMAAGSAEEETVPTGTPFAAYSSSPEPQQPAAEAAAVSANAAAGADADATAEHSESEAGGVVHQATEDAPDIDDLLAQQSTGVLVEQPAPADAVAPAAGSSASSASKDAANSSNTSGEVCSSGNCAAASTSGAPVTVPSAPSPWLSVHAPSSCNSSSSSLSRPSAPNPWEQLQPTASSVSGSSAAAAAGGPGMGGVTSAAAVTSPSFGAGETGDGWEMVSEDVPAPGSSSDAETLQSLVEQLSQGESMPMCWYLSFMPSSRACSQLCCAAAMVH
jgi:hypothetical protein